MRAKGMNMLSVIKNSLKKRHTTFMLIIELVFVIYLVFFATIIHSNAIILDIYEKNTPKLCIEYQILKPIHSVNFSVTPAFEIPFTLTEEEPTVDVPFEVHAWLDRDILRKFNLKRASFLSIGIDANLNESSAAFTSTIVPMPFEENQPLIFPNYSFTRPQHIYYDEVRKALKTYGWVVRPYSSLLIPDIRLNGSKLLQQVWKSSDHYLKFFHALNYYMNPFKEMIDLCCNDTSRSYDFIKIYENSFFVEFNLNQKFIRTTKRILPVGYKISFHMLEFIIKGRIMLRLTNIPLKNGVASLNASGSIIFYWWHKIMAGEKGTKSVSTGELETWDELHKSGEIYLSWGYYDFLLAFSILYGFRNINRIKKFSKTALRHNKSFFTRQK